MGVILRRRRGFGELSIVNGDQSQYVIGTNEAATDTGAGSIGSNNVSKTDAQQLPGSGDPKASTTQLASGADEKKETNWLGWGLVAAGVGGLILVGMAARKQRRRRA